MKTRVGQHSGDFGRTKMAESRAKLDLALGQGFFHSIDSHEFRIDYQHLVVGQSRRTFRKIVHQIEAVFGQKRKDRIEALLQVPVGINEPGQPGGIVRLRARPRAATIRAPILRSILAS